MSAKAKQLLLIGADIVLLYGTLLLILLVQYGAITQSAWRAHFAPFSILFVLWLAIFYIAGLYDITTLRRVFITAQQLLISVSISTALSMIAFYLVPLFEITPKTNLIIFAIVFSLVDFGWRALVIAHTKTPQQKALLLGDNSDVQEFIITTTQHPHYGYSIAYHITDPATIRPDILTDILKEYGITAILTTRQFAIDDALFDAIYAQVAKGVLLQEFTEVYEALLKKAPLSEIQHMWMLSSIAGHKRAYDNIKGLTERVLAAIALILALLPMVLIWLLIKLSSKGPGIYCQQRIGVHGTTFTLHKFRTMYQDAEQHGAQWAQPDDPRITPLGKLLRFTHLDELPQLYDILRGFISFVGPRPERPEFVHTLAEKIPYYEVRHLIKPGVTGWAQIRYRYGASLEDTQKKLQYDLYYIKHRAILLDALILLKTFKMFFFNHQ